MASRWFAGGLLQVEKNINQWANSAVLRASPVQGLSIVATQLSITTLQQFLGLGNTLVGTQALLGTRGYSWATDRYNYWFQDEINFGVVAQGTNIAGVVYYEGSSADPANASVWAAQENVGGPIASAGGVLRWGSSGQNVALSLRCLSVGNRYTFQGTLDAMNNLDDHWTSIATPYNIGYALVKSTSTVTPQFSWRFMSDLPVGSTLFWCTGASPGVAGMPVTPVGERNGPQINLNGSNDYFEYGIKSISAGRTPITWSHNALTAGETIKAVVAFSYTGSYVAGSARILHWDDVVDHLIAAGEDITYVQSTPFSMTEVRMA